MANTLLRLGVSMQSALRRYAGRRRDCAHPIAPRSLRTGDCISTAASCRLPLTGCAPMAVSRAAQALASGSIETDQSRGMIVDASEACKSGACEHEITGLPVLLAKPGRQPRRMRARRLASHRIASNRPASQKPASRREPRERLSRGRVAVTHRLDRDSDTLRETGHGSCPPSSENSKNWRSNRHGNKALPLH